MSVSIHPALAQAKNKSVLEKMQFAYGLRATTTGHLVLPNGKHPEMRKTAPARYTEVNNWPTGGDAA